MTYSLLQLEDPKDTVQKNGGSQIKPEDFPDFEDITDGLNAVLKKKLKEGTGETPKDGAVCSIHYIGWTMDDNEFENSKTGDGYPLDFNVKTGMVIAGIDLGVSGMQVGEISEFIMDPVFGWRDEGKPPFVPADAIVRYQIEFLSFENELTKKEKVELAKKIKDEGNALFKQQKYVEAQKLYKDALSHLGKFKWHINDPAVLAEQHSVRVSVLSNTMLCLVKSEAGPKAIVAAASNCLQFEPTHIKSLNQRCRAYIQLEEFGKADTDLQTLKTAVDKQETQDEATLKEIKKVQTMLNDAQQNTKKKQQQVFSKMLAHMNDGEGETAENAPSN
eukprot:TRINITY_DN11650_c0_g1_i1.p1 TRINITY_DN11650_c0_g1~~TRINITY_DN11650_c0_g1_i1.p1  ORF type:complete len:332 (-),score=57.74 TRINITY_DN11650_c0_g1_i1:59-1054(-)